MNEKNLLKKTIHEVMKASDFEISRIILFGSRARGNAKPTSDWDVMIIIKDQIPAKAKMYYSKKIREKLARLGIDGDIIFKSESEVERDKEIPGTVTREAVKEGVPL